MLAARELKSVSAILRDTSAEVPTFNWDVLVIVSSPSDKIKRGLRRARGAKSKLVLKDQLPTSDLSSERAAGDVLVVKLDDDVVVSGGRGQIGHQAGAVFVVLAGDLSL